MNLDKRLELVHALTAPPQRELCSFAVFLLGVIGTRGVRCRLRRDTSGVLLEVEDDGEMRVHFILSLAQFDWHKFLHLLAPYMQRDMLSERFGVDSYLLVLLESHQVLLLCDVDEDLVSIDIVSDPRAPREAEEILATIEVCKPENEL